MNMNSDSLGSDNIEFSRLSKQGYALLKQNKHEEALVAFNTIREKAPDNNYALVGIGDVLRKQKKYDEALPYYQHCLKNNPTNNFALFGIADIMRSQERYEESIEYWKKYLLYDMKNIAVITRVADSYRRLENIHESERYYKEALKIDAKNSYALIGLGWLYFGAKDFTNALDVWLKALEAPRDENDIRIYTAIGNCYYRLKEYQKAIGYYKIAEKMEPNNFFVLFGLANCHRGIREHEKSIDYLNRILKFDSKNQVVLVRLGDGYRNIGEYQEAKKAYQRALQVKFDVFATMGLANLAYQEGEYAQAVAQLVDLLQYKYIRSRVHERLEQHAQDPALPDGIRKKIKEIL